MTLFFVTNIRMKHVFLHNDICFGSAAEHWKFTDHYGDVTMGAIASQITSLTIVYSTVYSFADQRKHQSSALLASNAENASIWWRQHVFQHNLLMCIQWDCQCINKCMSLPFEPVVINSLVIAFNHDTKLKLPALVQVELRIQLSTEKFTLRGKCIDIYKLAVLSKFWKPRNLVGKILYWRCPKDRSSRPFKEDVFKPSRVLTPHGSSSLVPEYVSGFQGHHKGRLQYVKSISSQDVFKSGLKVLKKGLQDHLQRTSSRRQHP